MNTADNISQFAKALRNMERWLDKATAHAEAKKYDVNNLINARLAPDQYAFVRQVQAACDTAKFAAAYLAGKQAPAHPDTEKTMAELRQRIATCVGYLEGFKAEDFAGAAERKVSPAWMAPKWLTGEHYMNQLATPNFYFHMTTAYSILRNAGVDVGKTDFIGNLPVKEG